MASSRRGRRSQAVGKVGYIGSAVFLLVRKKRLSRQPVGRNVVRYLGKKVRVQLRSQQRICLRQPAGQVQQRMLLDHRKRRAAALQVIAPVVVKIERRAMVDQPQLVLPQQHVDVAVGAVHIRDKRIKPDDS